MRADHWLALHPEAPAALHQSIRDEMLKAFNPPSLAWREQVWPQALQASQQALKGLSGKG